MEKGGKVIPLSLRLPPGRDPSPHDSRPVTLLAAAFLRFNNSEKSPREKKRASGKNLHICHFRLFTFFTANRFFYISCYWKLSGPDGQAGLALASAAEPVSALYGPTLGRTFKPFNSRVIPMIQCRLCLKHLLLLSFSPRLPRDLIPFCFLFFVFSFQALFSNP